MIRALLLLAVVLFVSSAVAASNGFEVLGACCAVASPLAVLAAINVYAFRDAET